MSFFINLNIYAKNRTSISIFQILIDGIKEREQEILAPFSKYNILKIYFLIKLPAF